MSSFGSKLILCTFLFVNFLVLVFAKTGNSQLKQVQLLFRHGDRAPTKTYPRDQWHNAWPNGLGQLTTLGMLQQYRTGQYLRNRYGNLINNTYNHHTVHVRSTDVDRTLMSAYANLAGFLPPIGRHVWNANLTWQPIPVHTMPQNEDYLLSLDAECPRYEELSEAQMRSPEVEKVNFENREFFKFLALKTGLSINNFKQASSVFGILFIEQIYNMTQPNWVTDEVMEKLDALHLLKVQLRVKTHEQKRLKGGPLVGEMTKNIEKIIHNSSDKRKIYIYSAHDVTVVSLLAALGVYEPHVPPYCSLVMVELIEENGIDFVKILYRNDTSRDPYELILKGCSSPCPFEQFKKLTALIVPENIRAECAFRRKTSSNINLTGIAFASAAAGSIIGCALLLLSMIGYSFYKRKIVAYGYINIDDEL